jgi:hypothetical protein
MNANNQYATTIVVSENRAEMEKIIGSFEQIISIGRNDGKKGKSKNVASVPKDFIETVLSADVTQPWIRNAVVEFMAKQITEKWKTTGNLVLDFVPNEIWDAMQAELETATGSRLSVESISKFCSDVLFPIISADLASRGFAKAKIEASLKGFEAALTIVCQRNLNVTDQIEARILKILSFLPDDTEFPVASQILARLESHKAKAKAEESEDLDSILGV